MHKKDFFDFKKINRKMSASNKSHHKQKLSTQLPSLNTSIILNNKDTEMTEIHSNNVTSKNSVAKLSLFKILKDENLNRRQTPQEKGTENMVKTLGKRMKSAKLMTNHPQLKGFF